MADEPGGKKAAMRAIIVEQFQAEIAYKEDELSQIEDRIKLAKLMLQRLRMGVLAQHYGSAGFYPTELDYSKDNIGAQGSWDNFEETMLSGPQDNEDQESVHASKESTPPDPNESLTIKEEPMDFESIETKDEIVSKIKQEQITNGMDHQEHAMSLPNRVQPVCINKSTSHLHDMSQSQHTNIFNKNSSLESHDSRFYRKKRIIVGNTSQFLDPSSQCGGSTHKWMAYVRGSQTEPDISHFVKAVRFFLHPSYHPHDIILINNPPFHLTKLGWGEFPVRVQLEFSDPYNKPVDIIHNLVLDRTHTGHQTLGAETVVDLDLAIRGLAPTLKQDSKLPAPLPNGLTTTKPLVNGLDNDLNISENKELSMSEPDKEATHIQHQDSDNQVTLNEEDRMVVSPVVTKSPTAARCCAYVPKSKRVQETPMIVKHISLPLEAASDSASLDHDYCSTVVTLRTLRPALLRMPSRESSVATSDTTSRSKSSTPQVLTTNLDKCLHLAARNIPLCGRLSPNEGFMLAANSLAQFQSWSVGRRRACEWMRAVAIRQQVERQLRLPAVLTTKQVLQWARRNGYTPLDAIVVTPDSGFCKCCGCQLRPQPDTTEDGPSIMPNLHKSCSQTMQLTERATLSTPYNCFTDLLSVQDELNKEAKLKELNQEVDVSTIPETLPKQSNNSDELMPRFRIPQTPELKWIQQTAASVGIHIYPAVIDRMYAHVVEHMIYMSCARFLRSVLLQATQGSGHGIEGELSNERIITPHHVHEALCSLDSCDFVTNKHLGVESKGNDSESSSSDSDSD